MSGEGHSDLALGGEAEAISSLWSGMVVSEVEEVSWLVWSGV